MEKNCDGWVYIKKDSVKNVSENYYILSEPVYRILNFVGIHALQTCGRGGYGVIVFGWIDVMVDGKNILMEYWRFNVLDAGWVMNQCSAQRDYSDVGRINMVGCHRFGRANCDGWANVLDNVVQWNRSVKSTDLSVIWYRVLCAEGTFRFMGTPTSKVSDFWWPTKQWFPILYNCFLNIISN